MRYFPIFADLANARVVVAGGGQVALSKLRVLMKTEAKIEVYATKLSQEILDWHDEGKLIAVPRALNFGDLEGASLLYSTYFSNAQNEKIAALGRAAGVWTNVVDGPELSDFISPAIVDRDPVVVAIGTEGAAPVLARKIKTHLEENLPTNLGMMARVAKGFRHAVEALPFGRARRDFWTHYYDQNIQSAEGARLALEKRLEDAKSQAPKEGFVSFVGAGPGDPDLLTMKARKAIDKADIVIHDRLVSGEILELARREATLISVGKTGYGPSWTQNDINALMIEHARKGELVVRLKGGDVSIFGRLDEEIDAMRSEGIAFEVVPGITTASAAAASLGRSLTSRGRNSEIRFITAREVEGFAEHEWRALAKEGATAAIYMGGRIAHFLQGRLLMHGASPHTPITAIENVSRQNERVLESRLETLSADLKAFDPQGPVILLLGIAPHARKIAEADIAEVLNAASV